LNLTAVLALMTGSGAGSGSVFRRRSTMSRRDISGVQRPVGQGEPFIFAHERGQPGAGQLIVALDARRVTARHSDSTAWLMTAINRANRLLGKLRPACGFHHSMISKPLILQKARTKALAVMVAAAIGVGGVVTGGPAVAQVPPNTVRTVEWTLTEPNVLTRISYSTFLAGLRNLVSVQSSDGGLQTQNDSTGLVRVRLTAQGRTVTLWVQASTLYVLGFETPGGTVLWFNDNPQGTGGPGSEIRILPFGGNYNHLVAAAGRDRDQMPISWYDVSGSITQLATINYTALLAGDLNVRRATARSLMLLINMVSEAARLNDVEGTFRAAMNTWDLVRIGLPFAQQHLENNWGTLSNYFYQVGHGNLYPAPYIDGVGAVIGRDQVRRYVRVLLGSTKNRRDYDPENQQY
jgi:hypothetical protein